VPDRLACARCAPTEFAEGFMFAWREAEKCFGNSGIAVERDTVRPRNDEVEIFAEGQGKAVSFWERSASS
jgi:acetyl/propionyl-CoA carboxylase alpha subunit